LSKGSAQAFLDAFAEDGVMQMTAPEDTSMAGEFRGKEGVARYLALSSELAEIQTLEMIRDIIAHGDKVILLGYETARIAANGKVYASDWAAVFDMVDGKIARLLVIEDCSELTIACRGLG
jgi:ketosteroid isomerase-like protein